MAKKFFNYQNNPKQSGFYDNKDSQNERHNRDNRNIRQDRGNQNQENRDNFQRDNRNTDRDLKNDRNERTDRNFQGSRNDRTNRGHFHDRKKEGFQPRQKNQFGDKSHQGEKKAVEKIHFHEKKEILGKCILCQSNVSDDVYSLSLENEDLGKQYLHFECMVKRVKQLALVKFPKVNHYKVYYIGGGNFAAVVEKNYKGMQWEILFKTNIKEIQFQKPEPENQENTSLSS